MKTITKVRAGKLIAHWRLMPSDNDLSAVRDIVVNAVRKCGMDATIDVAVVPMECASLGHGRVTAVINVRNAYGAVRMADGTLVKGMDRITIDFDKCAGLFDFDAHCKRNDEEDKLFATFPKAKAMAAIDKLHWDAVDVHYSGRTNGKERLYRCRHFSPFEGRGHYGYGAIWADIADGVAEYIGGIARGLGYANKANVRKAA